MDAGRDASDASDDASLDASDAAVDLPLATCLPEFAVSPALTAVPKLPVTPGAVLWTHVDAVSLSVAPTLTVRGPTVAYPLGAAIQILDASDGVARGAPRVLGVGGALSAVSIDQDGNLYVASDKLFVMDPAGAPLWSFDLGPNQNQSQESTVAARPMITPSNDVIVVASDHVVRSIDIATRTENWHAAIPPAEVSLAPDVLRLGATGISVLTSWRTGSSHFDVETGASQGSVSIAGHTLTLGTYVWDGTLVGSYFDPQAFAWISHRLDRCGERALPEPQVENWNVISAYFGDRYLIRQHPPSARDFAIVHGATGAVDVPPTSVPGALTPLLVGADGTIYLTRCTELADGGLVGAIVALDATLATRWQTSFDGCYTSDLTIDSNGVLYVSRIRPSQDLEVIAIQTDSPGVADFAYPDRVGGHATGW